MNDNRSQFREARNAFTLIELLIVVAIIAILAAIAVPNFLEAQTRSKVARCRNDMRTLATAIEAYAVDSGKYPLDQSETFYFGYTSPDRENLREANRRLTTPISYITSVPNDPYLLYEDLGHTFRVYRWFVLRNPRFPNATTHPDDSRGFYDRAYGLGFKFYIRTIGPSVQFNYPGGGNVYLSDVVADPSFPLYIYDATNGTKSFGYIFRSNKGELDGSQVGRKNL